ncbi:uncharacterized protein NPIL_221741 [Nephila pilipes]|uniref:Uncharacterized protein n=1 Tax=Nephila pilipes TaxID=299642 RepID=A0A8X6PYP6_NEPPI|nr:uncharacterized protein NPIL_221741 [Nephila pilipes]
MEEGNCFHDNGQNQNDDLKSEKNKILNKNDSENNSANLPCFEVPPCDKLSKHSPLSRKERETLKIRYTRQYLLDRRYDSLSTAFPSCLLKFLQSGEVPLKETEVSVERTNGLLKRKRIFREIAKSYRMGFRMVRRFCACLPKRCTIL